MLATLKGAAALLICSVISASPITNSNSANSNPQTHQKTPREQTEFGSDSDLDRSAPIPPAALDALRSALKATPDELPGDELKASEIHFACTSEVDLVVPRVVGSHTAFIPGTDDFFAK